MRTRQFSSKDNADMQENKRIGTKTLPSSLNNFQLKAMDASESSKVDSSKGVAQLMLGALGNAASRAAPRLMGAAGRGAAKAAPYAKAAAGFAGGVTAFNNVTGIAKDAAFMGAGAAYNDPYLASEGAINGIAGQAGRMAPTLGGFLGLGGGINEAASVAVAKSHKELETRGHKKVIDPSSKFFSPETTDSLTHASNVVDTTPLGAINPMPGFLAMHDSLGLGKGVAGRMEQVKQDHEAIGIAAAAKRAKESAEFKAQFAINYPGQAKIADKAEADAHNPGFKKWADLGL